MVNRPKYLHIFAFTNIYCTFFQEFIQDHFNKTQHEFIYLQSKDKLSLLQKRKYWKSLEPVIKSSEIIFIHFLPTSIDLLFYFLNRKYLSKSCWSLWGRDVFYNKVKKGTFNKWIIESLRKRLIPKIGHIIGHPSDFHFLENNYTVKSEFNFVFYPLPGLSFEEKISFVNKEESTINILLGNSADPSNRHLITLDLLKQFKEDDLKIYCPISYGGTPEYANKVAAYGKNLFGDKFTPLLEIMPIEEYKQLLKTIDITVMNHERQQGLGNIRTLIFLGKKIFMSSKNTPLTQYREDLKFNLFDAAEIQNSSFEEFTNMPIEMKKENHQLAKHHFGKESILKMWGQLF